MLQIAMSTTVPNSIGWIDIFFNNHNKEKFNFLPESVKILFGNV